MRVILVVALAACAVALAAGDGEGVMVLEGEEMPMGHFPNAKQLGESAGAGAGLRFTSAATYAGTPYSAIFTYKVDVGGGTKELGELRGQLLMGESSDADQVTAHVSVDEIQSKLERHADVVGNVDRLTAAKVLMALEAAPISAPRELEEETLLQVSAGTKAGWGRRRRNSTWEKTPQGHATAKTYVKKHVVVEHGTGDAVDEARAKADKAIEMAREKGHKATKTAAREAADAAREASGKTRFEKAEKRKHEVTHKQEKAKEQAMKDTIEQQNKKAKESEVKAQELAGAVKAARDAAKAEADKERSMKKTTEKKLEEERRLGISTAKENGGKKTKEMIEKKQAKDAAEHAAEMVTKRMSEADMKHKHSQGEEKVKEVAKKKTAEMARQAAEEAKNKDAEEKALKHHDEATTKANHQRMKKANLEMQAKAATEGAEKKKRESALKVAAQRRIDEEKSAKKDKSAAMKASAELANKNAKEAEAKLEGEAGAKVKDEVAHKKDRELKEKKARETITKKEKEIVRKTTREHDDKTHSEKSTKKFSKERHNEKKAKGDEKIQKILGGLEKFTEKHNKLKTSWKEKKTKLSEMLPSEKNMKQISRSASRKAKELAAKIKGRDGGIGDHCDLSMNIENIKSKGLLSGSEGKCEVACKLEPSEVAIRAECSLTGNAKAKSGCKQFLYQRTQGVATALIAEFDAFKKCTIASSGAPSRESSEAEYLLGESNTKVEKTVKGGVSVGSFIYALKDLTDIDGSVNVGKAMDLLQKCDQDKKKPHDQDEDEDDELGDSYDPTQSARSGGGGKCSVKQIIQTLEAVIPDKTNDMCHLSCEVSGVDDNAYTGECSGSGDGSCFITGAESYQRELASNFMTWKATCADASDDY